MVLTEFDEEKYLKMMRAEERAEERAENLLSLLSDLGEVPKGIIEQVKELDRETLKQWTRMAVLSGSMEEFLQGIRGVSGQN